MKIASTDRAITSNIRKQPQHYTRQEATEGSNRTEVTTYYVPQHNIFSQRAVWHLSVPAFNVTSLLLAS
jgi:hypothetical protein